MDRIRWKASGVYFDSSWFGDSLDLNTDALDPGRIDEPECDPSKHIMCPPAACRETGEIANITEGIFTAK